MRMERTVIEISGDYAVLKNEESGTCTNVALALLPDSICYPQMYHPRCHQSSPVVSSKPIMIFKHCTAAPDAPFPRLSSLAHSST